MKTFLEVLESNKKYILNDEDPAREIREFANNYIPENITELVAGKMLIKLCNEGYKWFENAQEE